MIPPGVHLLPVHDHPGGGHHSIVIVEHDPMLYEDAAEIVDYVSHAQPMQPNSRPSCLSSRVGSLPGGAGKKMQIEFGTSRRARGPHQTDLHGIPEDRVEPDHCGGIHWQESSSWAAASRA